MRRPYADHDLAIKLTARRTRPEDLLRLPATLPARLRRDRISTSLRLKVGAFTIAASYVAASRIQAKRHFLSDVAFGAVLGVFAGRTVTVGLSRARFAVAPIALPGGGGFSFTLLQTP